MYVLFAPVITVVRLYLLLGQDQFEFGHVDCNQHIELCNSSGWVWYGLIISVILLVIYLTQSYFNTFTNLLQCTCSIKDLKGIFVFDIYALRLKLYFTFLENRFQYFIISL